MSTNEYLANSRRFKWGPKEITLNPEKSSLLKRFAKGKCLDVGFGSGIYTNLLYELGHKTTGVDAQRYFVKKASKKYPKLNFVQAFANNLPFEDGQFDTVVVFDLLEHLDDKKTIDELFRVGKRVIFSVPLRNQRVLTQHGLAHAHHLDRTHLRTYLISSLKKLFPRSKYKTLLLKKSLPISISGFLINRLSGGSLVSRIILKILLKPFLPEKPIFSTIFGVVEVRRKK